MREHYDYEIEETRKKERLEALEKFFDSVKMEVTDRDINNLEDLQTAIFNILWEIEYIEKM